MANEFLNDLGTALNMFNQGAQSLQLTRAANQANEAMAQIKRSEASQVEQKKQLRSLADSLAVSLFGNASPQQIQQFSQSISRPTPANPAEAYIEGTLFGDKDMRQAGIDLLSASGKKPETLSDKEAESIVKLEEQSRNAAELFRSFSQNKNWVGPVDGRISSLFIGADQAKFRTKVETVFQQLRQAITGAQASDREIERLREISPQVNDTEEVFRGKLQEALEIASAVRKRTLSVASRQGKDVSAFQSMPNQSSSFGNVKPVLVFKKGN